MVRADRRSPIVTECIERCCMVLWLPQQTFEEMMFGFVELIYDEDVGSPALEALREADRKTLPQDLGFASWNELIAWDQAMRARRGSR